MTLRLIRSGPMALWMLAGFLLLSVLDCATTLYLLHRGATEINPLMGWALERGELVFWIVKLGLALGVAAVLEAAYLRNRRLGFRIIVGVYAFQVIVVTINTVGVARIS